jgi:regulator of sigma E protease
MLVNLAAFVVVLGVLIILHEAGHFVAALAVGARADIFSVGFGRRLWGFEWRGTDFRVSLVPLGGYVRIIGLGPDESDVVSSDETEEIELLPRWKRAVILLAGPIANVLAAVGFVAVAYMAGVEVPTYRAQPPVVGWVDPGSPAAEAGVEPGDVVVSLDGAQIDTWRRLELETATMKGGGRTVQLTVKRDGRLIDLEMTPTSFSRYNLGYSGILPPIDPMVVRLMNNSPAARAGLEPGDRIVAVDGEPVEQFYDLFQLIGPRGGEVVTLEVQRKGTIETFKLEPEGKPGEGKIGIALEFPTEMQRFSPGEAMTAAMVETRRMTLETFRILGKLLTFKTSIRQMSGPLDIAVFSGEAARDGLHQLIQLLGMISLQLGIFNLLPIPILDGGHLTILAIESIRRRDLSIRIKERILEVGFILLILLMVVVLFNDIAKHLPQSVYQMIYRG